MAAARFPSRVWLALSHAECQGVKAILDRAMPIYEYRCTKGHVFDVRQGFTDDPLDTCEVCGAPAQKVLHAPAVHFKGSGFYNTDYGTRKRAREKESKEAASASGKSDSKDSSSSSSSSSSSDGSSSSSSDSKSSSSESGSSSDKKSGAKASAGK